MNQLLFLIHIILILMLTGCSAKVVTEPETDENVSMGIGRKKPVINTDAIVPAYVVDAKELFGLGIKESAGKVMATTNFWFRRQGGRYNMYLPYGFDYGRPKPYFRENTSHPLKRIL